MLRRWLVFGAAALTVMSAEPWGTAQELFSFLAPENNTIVLGPTELRFSVGKAAKTLDQIDCYYQGRLIGSATYPSWSFSWDFPAGVSGAHIVAVAYSDGKMVGRRRRETMAIPFSEEIQVAMVQLYPVVVDAFGRYIRDQAKQDFVVLDQGNPVEIEGFASTVPSSSVAVVLDVSQSMLAELGLVQDASCDFVRELDKVDRVSLYAFNHAVLRIVDLTRDHEQVITGVRSLHAAGGTALYDALVTVLGDLESAHGRKAILLFSDGNDKRSLITCEQAVRTARASEVIIYAVGAGDDASSKAGRQDLEVLAEETGGKAYYVTRLKELPDVFSSVLEHLKSQYMLSYYPPPGPPGIRDILVEVKGHRVHCRRSYYHDG